MSEFSKGNWRVSNISASCVSAYDWERYGVIIVEEVEGKNREEAEANTRLIVAAPEMYGLLLDCAEYLEGYLGCEPPEEYSEVNNLMKDIDNLLARIDGKEKEHDKN